MPTLADLVTTRDAAKAKLTEDTAALVATQATSVSMITAANDSVVAAQKVVADDNTAIAADESAIGSAVGSQGAFFVVNPDGTATVYESDGAGGYKTTVAQPGSTTVGGGPVVGA